MLVTYAGGPVVYCPIVYTSFWGPSWTGANASLASQLNQFIQDLMASTPWMNVLTQYGVAGTGAHAQASFLEFLPSTLTVSSYEAIFQSCINAGLIPEPANVNNSKAVSVVVVFLDQSVIINGGGRQLNFPGAPDAGYHDSFTTAAGNPFIYSFTEFSDIKSICSVTSHEFAEMITDPLYNAWTPDHASHEIGDYCSWQESTITVGGRTWTVQEIWSDVANACVSSAPSKIAPIEPGPGGAQGLKPTQSDVSRLGRGPARPLDPSDVSPHDRVLPLPPVRFDHQSGSKRVLDADMLAYMRRLFSPLRHEHLFDDFPGFLHQAATLLEGKSSAVLEPLDIAGDQSRPGVAQPVEAVRREGIVPKAQPSQEQTSE